MQEKEILELNQDLRNYVRDFNRFYDDTETLKVLRQRNRRPKKPSN